MDHQAKKFSLEELRKKYPKAGKRWEAEEDAKLKQLYQAGRPFELADFEKFIIEITKEFSRAPGGLKARLAMHFQDVPGWDYSQKEEKEKRQNAELERKFDPKKDDWLKAEYQNYLQSKKFTFTRLMETLEENLMLEKSLIKYRLEQLVGPLVKYKKEDIKTFGSKSVLEEPALEVDFKGNGEALEALDKLQNSRENLFLTGEAGTGKSTLLKVFRQTTEKNVVVLAPTGVAALNVQGQTIHSFCGFGPDITLAKVKRLYSNHPKFKLLQKLDIIVIDEISMVRADLLDCVDKFLRLNGPEKSLPFGGLQMAFFGDLYQLPPVEKDFQSGDGLIKNYQSPYFFDSRAFRMAKFNFINLKTIYRQKDQVFKDVLNAVRNNTANQEHLTILNARAEDGGGSFKFEKFAIYLTPHNARANKVNNFFMEKLKTDLHQFRGVAVGSFEDRELPTDLNLQVKVGAQIMMLNNDSKRRWVNGTMGKVVGVEGENKNNNYYENRGEDEFEENFIVLDEGIKTGKEIKNNGGEIENASNRIIVELETGETVYVAPYTWEMYKFILNKHTQNVESEVVGRFTQYPFKLAWAVTIHKAQGKTFDKVYVDLTSGTFAHGQLYVALSRCRSLEGLYLKRPIIPEDIILDKRVVEFLKSVGD